MFCRKCGKENPDAGTKCFNCGALLHGAAGDDSTLGGLIPYKNSSALVAYYLAVFSAIPCVGLFLGIAGLIMGLKGLRFFKEHPERGGKVHALIGIWVGGFFGFLYLILLLVVIFLFSFHPTTTIRR